MITGLPIICQKPAFTDTVQNEKQHLQDYLAHEAYRFEDFSITAKHLRFEFIPHYHPTPEALEKARAKYEADKSRYLETGELPAE